MAVRFNERDMDAEIWNDIGNMLRSAVRIMDGTSVPIGKTIGRTAEMLINEAEYLEAAARFLRRTEIMLVESRR